MSDSIHELVRAGNIDEVRTYIATGGDINISDKHQRTPLHLAAWSGNYEILDLLLKSKAISDKKAMDNFTILHFAVQSNNKDTQRVTNCIRLIVKKAKQLLNQRTSKGNKSAIHLAVSKGNEDIVRCLLECGIDANAKMSNGQTAMDIAKSESMKTLLQSSLGAKKNTNEENEERSSEEEGEGGGGGEGEGEEAQTEKVQPALKKRKMQDKDEKVSA